MDGLFSGVKRASKRAEEDARRIYLHASYINFTFWCECI